MAHRDIVEGPSIIRRVKIVGYERAARSRRSRRLVAVCEYYRGDDTLKVRVDYKNTNCNVGDFIKAAWVIGCDNCYEGERYWAQTDGSDLGFLQKDVFYSYHDYALLQSDLVYYHAGYNILYKVKPKVKNDSILLLSFSDISGKTNTLSKKLTDSLNIPEYYCVFRNINPKYDKGWVIAAPEVNTPENWAKISDYGYIFHYDVYSKDEIESQCPQIRNYVEKYKERNTEK